jgi:hypothetical protein
MPGGKVVYDGPPGGLSEAGLGASSGGEGWH